MEKLNFGFNVQSEIQILNLIKKLFHYGIRGVAHDFFKSYLTDRKQYTFVNGVKSEWLWVLCGVPQGSVLGPLLFLLYTNDLSYASNFSINLFADDTCLSMWHKNIRTLNRQCNIEAACVDEWFKANRLTTNSKKSSNFLLSEYYSDPRNPYRNFTISMGNVLSILTGFSMHCFFEITEISFKFQVLSQISVKFQ